MNEGILSHQTSQSFCFSLPWKHVKGTAWQNKRMAVSQMASRTRKVFGTFKKRVPAGIFFRFPGQCSRFSYLRWSFLARVIKPQFKNVFHLFTTTIIFRRSRPIFWLATEEVGVRVLWMRLVWIWTRKLVSIQCRKTKTKVITLANQKGRRQSSRPIKTRSN